MSNELNAKADHFNEQMINKLNELYESAGPRIKNQFAEIVNRAMQGEEFSEKDLENLQKLIDEDASGKPIEPNKSKSTEEAVGNFGTGEVTGFEDADELTKNSVSFTSNAAQFNPELFGSPEKGLEVEAPTIPVVTNNRETTFLVEQPDGTSKIMSLDEVTNQYTEVVTPAEVKKQTLPHTPTKYESNFVKADPKSAWQHESPKYRKKNKPTKKFGVLSDADMLELSLQSLPKHQRLICSTIDLNKLVRPYACSLTLSDVFYRYMPKAESHEQVIRVGDAHVEFHVDQSPRYNNCYRLPPGHSVGAITEEEINLPYNMYAEIKPILPYTMLGLVVTAPIMQPSKKGRIYLTIQNTRPDCVIDLPIGQPCAEVQIFKPFSYRAK